MIVYVIEKGYYSDRHIVGVVETEEEAMKICDVISCGWDGNTASYRSYDTKQFKTSRMRFTVMRDEYNNLWHAEYDEYLYDNYHENAEIYEDKWVIYADDSSQAIKIAQDMYYEKEAKEEGIL